MIVVDASVLADALIDDGPVGDAARAVLSKDPHWAAPAHLPVEVLSVIRGRTLGGKLGLARAQEAVEALPSLVIELIDTTQLVDRMWQLRGSITAYGIAAYDITAYDITAYDAAYVAAAETLGCPLFTGDARLAKATGVRCEIRLVRPTV